MRTFGAFSAKGGKAFYGELIGDEVSVLERPFWLSIEPTGEKIGRRDLEIGVPVSPSKLIAVIFSNLHWMKSPRRQGSQ